MLKQYNVNAHIDGHYTIEDPKCPSEWRGSGCYVIDVQVYCDTELDVWAVSKDQAGELAAGYDYPLGPVTEVRDIIVKDPEFICDLSREEDEAGVIEPVEINWIEKWII